MILYIRDNLLKVRRVLNLAEAAFCPVTPAEEFPSIEYSEANVMALYAAEIDFVLDLSPNEVVPSYVKLKPGSRSSDLLRWYVPDYSKDWEDKASFDVEYNKKDGQRKAVMYASAVPEEKFEKAMENSLMLLRVCRSDGRQISKAHLKKFGLKSRKNGEFYYAVPKDD